MIWFLSNFRREWYELLFTAFDHLHSLSFVLLLGDGVAYRIIDEDVTRLDLMAGARYFKLDLDFDADVGGS